MRRCVLFTVAITAAAAMAVIYGGSSPLRGDTPASPPSDGKSGEERMSEGMCYNGPLRAWRPAKCAEDVDWLRPWARVRPSPASWSLVDVGANKGYVIAGWLQTLLGSRTSHSPHHVGVGIYSTYANATTGAPPSFCGGCCECVEPAPTETPPPADVRVWAFEPSVANFEWLSSFFKNEPRVNVTHAAVSHTPSEAYFPTNAFGVETGKVRTTPAGGFVRVPVVSLATALPPLPFIDVLATDAEGFDQDVARGASPWLFTGKVGVYQFEMYRPDHYRDIFHRLEKSGMVCYFPTERRRRSGAAPPMYVRITHGCWRDVYGGYVGWVNAVCYNQRIPELRRIFADLEKRPRLGATGNCPSREGQRRAVERFVKSHVKW